MKVPDHCIHSSSLLEATLAASNTDLVLITECFITLGQSQAHVSHYFQVYTQSRANYLLALALH